jgi:hypothetical protein
MDDGVRSGVLPLLKPLWLNKRQTGAISGDPNPMQRFV